MGDSSFVAAETERGPTIKDVYKDYFLIGTAGDLPGNYSEEELASSRAHFNIVTPENWMKPGPVHPAENTWRFERPDALVNWCAENSIAVHGHTLVWHAQTNNWFFHDGDKEVVTQRLKDHITHAGRAVQGEESRAGMSSTRRSTTAATPRRPRRRTSAIPRGCRPLGPEFLTLAFKVRPRGRPGRKAVLQRLQHRVGPKHESSMVLLKRLVKDGAPIHGVGIQGHWSTATVPYEALDKAIGDYASLGLKVSITELDVTIRGAAGAQSGREKGRGQARLPPKDLKAQAEAYARLFAIFIKHKDVVERVTFWGLNDRRTWRSDSTR